MKEVNAYQSLSGDLYKTQDEARAKDLTDAIIIFMQDDYSYYDVFKIGIAKIMAEKIVKNKAEFLKIIGNL